MKCIYFFSPLCACMNARWKEREAKEGMAERRQKKVEENRVDGDGIHG